MGTGQSERENISFEQSWKEQFYCGDGRQWDKYGLEESSKPKYEEGISMSTVC